MKIKKFGAAKVAPTHCSGDLARNLFKANFKDNFIEIGTGSEIEI
jgi:7,8-dihydropterin-6-yl-methyl-4-(beta-D-ribofuranosyl)aminobenzene 5'-phosphate synthase